MGFKVDGLTAWQKKLKQLENDYPKACETALQKEAEKVQGATKSKTPLKTGALRAGWHIDDSVGPDTRIVFNNTDYGNHVEWGHRTRGGKGFVRGRYMLYLAVKDSAKRFTKVLNQLIKKLIGGKK